MEHQSTQKVIEISIGSIVRAVLFFVGCFVAYMIRDVFVLLIVSFILSSGISLVAKWIQKKISIPYGLGVFLVFLGVLGAFASLILTLIPAVTTEFQALVNNTPKLIAQIDQLLVSLVGPEAGSVSDLIGPDTQVTRYAWEIASGIFFTTRGIVSSVFYTAFVFLATFYMAYDPRSFDDIITFFFPNSLNRKVRKAIQKSRRKVGNWIVGQMVVSSVLGLISYISLELLGVQYALLLAVFAGLFNMIPFIGPVISMVPAVFFALFQSVQTGIIVALIYTGLQQLEGNFLTPIIMNKVTGLSTVIIIVSILLGATLAGALGALIAVPVASVISLFVEDLQEQSATAQ